MANAIPIRVAGNGTSVLSYELPANLLQFVQSVNAVIDNSSGGVTTPTLTVLDSTNEVIADVPQGRSIPAGDSGRATWARRLADESAGAAGASGEGHYNDGAGVQIIAAGSNFLPWVFSSGDALLDVSVPISPVVLTGGVYAFNIVVVQVPFGGAGGGAIIDGRVSAAFFLPGLGVLPAGFVNEIVGSTHAPFAAEASVACTAAFPAGTVVRALATNAQPVTTTFQLGAYVTRLA